MTDFKRRPLTFADKLGTM